MKNEKFIINTKVLKRCTDRRGTVIDCGTLEDMYNKYEVQLFDANADRYFPKLKSDPDMDVCVIKFDGDHNYTIVPTGDLRKAVVVDDDKSAIGTRVVIIGTPDHGIVIDCGTLKEMYNKYANHLLDANAEIYTHRPFNGKTSALNEEPYVDVCVVQVDGDGDEYSIIPVSGLKNESVVDEDEYI